VRSLWVVFQPENRLQISSNEANWVTGDHLHAARETATVRTEWMTGRACRAYCPLARSTFSYGHTDSNRLHQSVITLHAKVSGAGYCYRSCLWRSGGAVYCYRSWSGGWKVGQCVGCSHWVPVWLFRDVENLVVEGCLECWKCCYMYCLNKISNP